ncbi:MAG: GDP-L-fucose synthase [Nanoarchaeota archaeon]|nr:GDP-L-fucose synthase [Nanoarchaeota archaeon]
MFNGKKILVTGGSGMVGKALKEIIPNSIFLSSKDDLRYWDICDGIFKNHKPQIVIHLAAKVGGIKANQNYVGSFYRDNVLINTNVLDAARLYSVEKLISLLSTCVFPDKVQYPLTEEQLHDGMPNDSNYGYAYSKRMLDVQSRAYRKQFGCNFITAIPNNIFGEHDRFHLEDGHVVPAMIRKIYEAKLENRDVELWSSQAIREFTYSGDIAKSILFLMENYNEESPVNIGNTEEYTIEQISNLISYNLGFTGKIIWNNSNLGQLKKPSSNKKFLELGWKKEDYTNVEDALKETCEWFVSMYPNVRGIK